MHSSEIISSQSIQLFISCQNLKDQDVFSISDPFVNIYFRRDFNVKQYSLLGRTQTINNNLNPNFTKTFKIEYIFQSRQDIKFDVMDDDSGNDDFIGSCQTTIGKLMGAKNQTSILDLKKDGKNKGKIVIRCEKLTQSNQFIRMKWRGVKLMNVDSNFDFWDKSDPYLKFFKYRDDNSCIEIARTNTIIDSLDPVWDKLELSLPRLINPNFNKFKIQCWDWQENGKDQFIGDTDIDMKVIMTGVKQFALINDKKKKPGKVVLDSFSMIQKPSFLDYMKGGLELNMVIAVDFTASNQLATKPTSLHYMNPNGLNQYETAIMSIASILINYDADKRIPCLGFGALPNFPGFQQISHCFPLSGSYDTVQAVGLQNMLSVYRNAVKNVQLAGPTYFSEVIEQTMKFSYKLKSEKKMSYLTLLILTDGNIHDMNKTIDLLYKATDLPISVIIVGVGKDDFEQMRKLDGDGGLYNSEGTKLKRDIVQFVPFRDVNSNPDILAKQLLSQLPNQVVQYMSAMGISPLLKK